MKCPFLEETHVKFCQASPFKKMIVQSSEISGEERCSSPEYAGCPAARDWGDAPPVAPRCPYLQVSLVQYCSADSVPRYIPYSESLLSRCGGENYRYCELHLSLADPSGESGESGSTAGGDEGPAGERSVEGVRFSDRLAYSSNHMWLDEGSDGSYHVGIDALFAKVLGKVERLNFLTPKGSGRPTAVISACGVDFPMIFPNPIEVTRANDHLRANPERMISHPYTHGWLFEGRASDLRPYEQDRGSRALMRGRAALEWMRAEVERISRFLHERCAASGGAGGILMMDGGAIRSGVVHHLDLETVLALFNEFFAS